MAEAEPGFVGETHPAPSPRAAPDSPIRRTTPEIYLGRSKGRWPYPSVPGDEPSLFFPLAGVPDGVPVLEGSWSIQDDRLLFCGEPSNPGRMAVSFEAESVHLVMGSKGPDPAEVQIRLDGGVVPIENRGEDAPPDGPSAVTVGPFRMYTLLTHLAPGRHRLDLGINRPGWEGYTIAFSNAEPSG